MANPRTRPACARHSAGLRVGMAAALAGGVLNFREAGRAKTHFLTAFGKECRRRAARRHDGESGCHCRGRVHGNKPVILFATWLSVSELSHSRFFACRSGRKSGAADTANMSLPLRKAPLPGLPPKSRDRRQKGVRHRRKRPENRPRANPAKSVSGNMKSGPLGGICPHSLSMPFRRHMQGHEGALSPIDGGKARSMSLCLRVSCGKGWLTAPP